MPDDESSSRGFKVEDRRRFSATGDPRTESESPEPAAAKPAAEAPAPEPAPQQTSDRTSAPPLPEMTFSTFVIGLSTQALVLLGEMADPASQATQADLVGAKQLIDILGLLQSKTQGNLDEAERALLESALYDLRMKYVQRTRAR